MKQKTRRRLQNIGVLVLIALGLWWVFYQFVGFTSSTFTDNAQVRMLIVPVNSRIQGFVKEVRFDDFTRVEKGDTLVIIEDTEFKLRVAQAQADLANASAGSKATASAITTTRNNLTVSDAALAETKARLTNAEAEYHRYQQLFEQEAVTRQQLDAVTTEYEALKARCDMLARQKQTTALTTTEQGHRLDQSSAGIDVAQAALDLANLNLSYTVILAPCSGYCSRKAIQPGQLVQPGQTLLSVVDTSDVWVVANYKEKQTSNMKVGDPVKITVDAIPGVTFEGSIEAISGATGAQYSVVPQDNSTGNFVKVQQRVPIKIRFDASNSPSDMERLRAGLNVECRVDVNKQ